MRRHIAAIAALLLISLGISCQTFRMRKPLPKPLGSFQQVDRGNYRVKADLLSPEQSKQYFGVNLNEIAIQPANIEIENKNSSPLQLSLNEIYVKDKDQVDHYPLTLEELAQRIYEANQYKEMLRYGAKDAALYGAAGVIIGVVGGLIRGRSSLGQSGAIGGWGGASTGAIKGASEARQRATERIKGGLGELMMTSHKIPEDSKVKGLVFFQISPEEALSLKTLEIHLTETETPNRLDLELELQLAPEDKPKR